MAYSISPKLLHDGAGTQTCIVWLEHCIWVFLNTLLLRGPEWSTPPTHIHTHLTSTYNVSFCLFVLWRDFVVYCCQIYFWNLFYGTLFERRSLMHKLWHTMLKDTESMKLYWFECVPYNNWVGLCFGVFSA